jgi:hypothetical protein
MCFVKQLPQRLVYCEKKSKSCGSVIKIPQLVVLSETISSRREWYSPAKKEGNGSTNTSFSGVRITSPSWVLAAPNPNPQNNYEREKRRGRAK